MFTAMCGMKLVHVSLPLVSALKMVRTTGWCVGFQAVVTDSEMTLSSSSCVHTATCGTTLDHGDLAVVSDVLGSLAHSDVCGTKLDPRASLPSVTAHVFLVLTATYGTRLTVLLFALFTHLCRTKLDHSVPPLTCVFTAIRCTKPRTVIVQSEC